METVIKIEYQTQEPELSSGPMLVLDEHDAKTGQWLGSTFLNQYETAALRKWFLEVEPGRAPLAPHMTGKVV